MTFADPTKQPLIVTKAYQRVKDFQGDNPDQMADATALSAYIEKLHEHLESADWPRTGSAYLLVMGRQKLEPMQLPGLRGPGCTGKRFVLLKFSGQPGNEAH